MAVQPGNCCFDVLDQFTCRDGLFVLVKERGVFGKRRGTSQPEFSEIDLIGDRDGRPCEDGAGGRLGFDTCKGGAGRSFHKAAEGGYEAASTGFDSGRMKPVTMVLDLNGCGVGIGGNGAGDGGLREGSMEPGQHVEATVSNSRFVGARMVEIEDDVVEPQGSFRVVFAEDADDFLQRQKTVTKELLFVLGNEANPFVQCWCSRGRTAEGQQVDGTIDGFGRVGIAKAERKSGRKLGIRSPALHEKVECGQEILLQTYAMLVGTLFYP